MGLLKQLSLAIALGLFALATAVAGTTTGTESKTVRAETKTIIDTWPAVGTVRPRSQIQIDAQIQAQVKTVHVKAGDGVAPGDLLVTLDSRTPLSNLDQARQGVTAANSARQNAIQGVKAAKAALNEAELNYRRIKTYVESNAATPLELEAAESGFIQAKASLSISLEALSQADSTINQAEETVKQAQVGLEFTTLRSPVKGEVIRQLVQPGDLALPGKPMILLRTETGFRIEAHVREGLVGKVSLGALLIAEIPTLKLLCSAVVEEIVPYADPETRTFLVKAAIDQTKTQGLYPGMYAKLLIPESEHTIVVIPGSSVIRTGQLDLVRVKTDQGWERRYITTGKVHGGNIEVLSGISPGETVEIQK
jgi:RND family efflux transporter MFP subunit